MHLANHVYKQPHLSKKFSLITLPDSVISTLERQISHTESKCKIKLDKKTV